MFELSHDTIYYTAQNAGNTKNASFFFSDLGMLDNAGRVMLPPEDELA